MRFRLVPQSVTLNDLGRRNSSYFALFHGIRRSVALAADYVKVVENRPIDKNRQTLMYLVCNII